MAPPPANTLANENGMRFHSLPLGPDRIYHAIDRTFADGGWHGR
jgi:hypothetical protein